MTIWSPDVCTADAVGSAGTGGTQPPRKHAGGCGVAGSPGARSAAVLLLLVIGAALRRRAHAHMRIRLK
jgi:MYXO-CTERM domain-containing protein